MFVIQGEEREGRRKGGRSVRRVFLLFIIDPSCAQGQLVVDVLVVFVSVAVRGDEGAGFGVADVLHLVQVVFDADAADVAEGAEDGGHFGLVAEAVVRDGVGD